MGKTILLAAFEPFAGESQNASELALRTVNLPFVEKIILPVIFEKAFAVLNMEISQLKQLRHIVVVGQAGSRSKISIEKVALNYQNCGAYGDNEGFKPKDFAVIPGAPAAYFTAENVPEIIADLEKISGSIELSLSAGAFVCNDTYYRLLHTLETRENLSKIKGLFVHVPTVEKLPTEQVSPVLTHLCNHLQQR